MWLDACSCTSPAPVMLLSCPRTRGFSTHTGVPRATIPIPWPQTAVASLAHTDPIVPTACRAEGHLHPALGMLHVHGLSHRGCVEVHHCGEMELVTHLASAGTRIQPRGRLGRGTSHSPHHHPMCKMAKGPMPLEATPDRGGVLESPSAVMRGGEIQWGMQRAERGNTGPPPS